LFVLVRDQPLQSTQPPTRSGTENEHLKCGDALQLERIGRHESLILHGPISV